MHPPVAAVAPALIAADEADGATPKRNSLSVDVPPPMGLIRNASMDMQQYAGPSVPNTPLNVPMAGTPHLLSATSAAARAPLSRRGSKFLTRTHMSYSNIPTAEEKIELASLGGGPAARTPGSRSRKLLRGASSAAGGGSNSGDPSKNLISFHLNDPVSIAAGQFPSNFIKTSKYTWLTFLPLNLFEQFRRVANMYFLFVVIIQTIPGVSPFPIYTSLAPLIFILAIGALNEAREDVQRHKADRIANSRPCELVQPGGIEVPTTSASVAVGQILKISQNQEFPADLILLHTAREDGTCYVNTANLDGEAAPKVRSASPATQNIFATPQALTEQLRGRIQYEAPNASLYRFQGNVLLQPASSAANAVSSADGVLSPLGDKQLLLRGAKLVNTAFVYGLVVYTGAETKMMLNRNPARFKFSHFEAQLNKCVIVCLIINLVICLIPSFFYIAQDDTFAVVWDIDKTGGLGWLLDFITLYILFSFMVPQSLYVTIELVKVGQAKFMEWDNEMGWTDPDTGVYNRCQVKASALNEELGTVDVVCTDKTGTLTSNHMELSRCSVGGALYFENDTHRDNHQLGNAQSEAHRNRYGAHKLMRELNAVAFAKWVAGRDEQGRFVFDHSDDWTQDEESSPDAAAAAEKQPLQPHQTDSAAPSPLSHANGVFSGLASIDSHGEDESSASPPGLKPRGQFPSASATARDFLLNILLCNGTLPSWKAVENKGDDAEDEVHVVVKSNSPSSADGDKAVPELVSPDEAAPLASPKPRDNEVSPPAEAGSDPAAGELAVPARSMSPVSQQHHEVAAQLDEQRRGQRLVFESQSPDEIALLQAAQRLGASFTQRSGNKLTIEINLPAGHPASPQSSPHAAWPSPRSKAPALGELEPRDIPLKPHDSRLSLVYTVLAELEFASAWRRNSVVVRGPDGALKLFTKGADTTVAALIDHSDRRQQELLQLIMAQATEFAGTGSRTLLFASRPLSDEEFQRWWPTYDVAQNAFSERDKRIERAFSLLEKDMFLLGCSAVDDQLQELVPQTVDFLLASKLQIIVLTGDKKETGVEIAKQSHLVKPGFHVLYLAATSAAEVETNMRTVLEDIVATKKAYNKKHGIIGEGEIAAAAGNSNKLGLAPVAGTLDDPRHSLSSLADSVDLESGRRGAQSLLNTVSSSPKPLGFALAVDGVALELALLYHRDLFMQIFVQLETVVSYRATPMQKALVVRLMKETGKTVLAIGDGANDCSMIAEAHVGIGILGKEGAHAAMASDFVLHRFHHLRRLICVHGRYSYWRTTQVVMFSFYKNLAFPLPLFWYCFYSMANGTTSYDSLLITTFNTFFTSLPPFFAGLFDKDVPEATLMQSPAAFDAFKRQTPFTVRAFVYTLLSATYQSVVFYFFAHFLLLGSGDVIHHDGRPADMAVMGNMMLTGVVLTTNFTMLFALSAINYVNVLAMGIGFILYLAVFVFEAAAYQIDLAPDGYGMGEPIFGAASAWLYFIFVAVLCLLPNAIYEVWTKLYHPQTFQQLQHVPPELIAQREQAEKQQVRDAEIATQEAAEQASRAAAASKAQQGNRRAAQVFKDVASLSPHTSFRAAPAAAATGEEDAVHFRIQQGGGAEAASSVELVALPAPTAQPGHAQSQTRAALHVDVQARD